MSMQSSTISILGCGWLGLPLGQHLAARGWRVKGSTTTSGKLDLLAGAGIDPFLLTLGTEWQGDDVARFFSADVLFFNVPPSRGDGAGVVRKQAEAVLEAARRTGLGWIIYASSTSTYASLNRVVTEEDAYAGEPSRASGRALREAERLLREAPDVDATILRLAGLYGPDRPPGRFLAGRTNVDGGAAPVNLVHLEDCIGVVEAVLQQDARGDLFNVCADEHPARRTFYPQAARAQGLEPPTFAADGARAFKVVSNDKVRTQLGYTFRHPDPLADVTSEHK